MEIEITLSRDINNLPRIARFTALTWLASVKQIVVSTIYGVYQDNEFTYGTQDLQMVASNATWVDPKTGATVPEGTQGAIGEYDYFMLMIQSPINLPTIIQSYMQKASDAGKYN